MLDTREIIIAFRKHGKALRKYRGCVRNAEMLVKAAKKLEEFERKKMEPIDWVIGYLKYRSELAEAEQDTALQSGNDTELLLATCKLCEIEDIIKDLESGNF